MRLMLDSNIVIDFLAQREPFHKAAELLFMLGRADEFDLWLSTAQANDIFYVLSGGGKPSLAPQLKEDMRELRKAVRLCPLSEAEFDNALASPWLDVEDACVHLCALKIKADAIITRNKKDFMRSSINVFDCDELFAHLKQEQNLVYEFTDF